MATALPQPHAHNALQMHSAPKILVFSRTTPKPHTQLRRHTSFFLVLFFCFMQARDLKSIP